MEWNAIFSGGCFAGVRNQDGWQSVDSCDLAAYLKERQVVAVETFVAITSRQRGSYPFCVNGDKKPPFTINNSRRPDSQDLVIALENGEIQVADVIHKNKWITERGNASWIECKVSLK